MKREKSQCGRNRKRLLAVHTANFLRFIKEHHYSLIDFGFWLKIFDAHTEEDIEKLLELEVPIMQQTISAYRELTGDSEFLRLVCQ